MAETRDILWRFLGDAKGLNQATKGAEKGLGGVSGAMGMAGKAAAGLGLALGGAQLAGYAMDAIDLASAAEEVNSKFKAVFGAADDFKRSLSEWGDVAGVTDTKAYDLAATFGNLAMSAGLGKDETINLTSEVATLAGDLGSFNDADPAEVFHTLNSAILTTEREGLKKFGIALGEAEVKQRALQLAIADGRSEATNADRALASYQLIVEKSGKATGDLGRTADSTANQQRILKASMAETQEEIGRALLPVYRTLIKVMNEDMVPVIEDIAPLLEDVVTGFSDVIESMRPIIKATGWVLAARNAVSDFSAAAATSRNPVENFVGIFTSLVSKGSLAAVVDGFRLAKDAVGELRGESDPAAKSMSNITLEAELLGRKLTQETIGALKGLYGAAGDATGKVDELADAEARARDEADEASAAWGRWVDTVNSRQFDRDKLDAGRSTTRAVSGGDQRQEFASGGIVAGPRGTAQSIVAHAGERVVPLGSDSGGGSNITINIGVAGDPYQTARTIADLLTRYEQANGTRITGVGS